ncbi:MAG TPA: hypothetical protein VFW07_22830 [Parafilimonas sp.]|nr:hypothetical protein [Parafilimonas sp.]
MKYIVLCFLSVILFTACKKDSASGVDIYLLESFTLNDNNATNPVTLAISNAVLAAGPLVADEDISYYVRSTATFKLKKDIQPLIKNYDGSKAFAVTVNKQPVYFGRFHPSYLSSLTLGLATIDPLFHNNNELPVFFIKMDGNEDLQLLDKRSDDRLISALKASGKLR